mmetsp:Transcript_9864/g.29677  ORF Transcript_9864/g.29677 Transcript_9864/m.29677 type:complete len:207 (-) Transcript_9864:256-876(-)
MSCTFTCSSCSHNSQAWLDQQWCLHHPIIVTQPSLRARLHQDHLRAAFGCIFPQSSPAESILWNYAPNDPNLYAGMPPPIVTRGADPIMPRLGLDGLSSKRLPALLKAHDANEHRRLQRHCLPGLRGLQLALIFELLRSTHNSSAQGTPYLLQPPCAALDDRQPGQPPLPAWQPVGRGLLHLPHLWRFPRLHAVSRLPCCTRYNMA